MKVDVYHKPGWTHDDHTTMMAEGLRRHGLDVARFGERPRPGIDVAVVWSWRVGLRVRQEGFGGPILVMERGYLGDRFHWTSLGWDELNGRARFNGPHDSGERFWRNFGHLVCEWERDRGYALVIGQVETDMAVRHVPIHLWYMDTIAALERMGYAVRFRPHPQTVQRRGRVSVQSSRIVGGTLEEAFREAGIVVTLSSNTAVESVLAGIPTYALDEGSMAYEVSANTLSEKPIMPDREIWFRDLAWKQWEPDEFRSGEAWEIACTAMHA